MDLVVTLLVGGVMGWLASLVLGTDDRMGLLANVLVGLVGSVLGQWLAEVVGWAQHAGPARWLAALVGALLLIGIVRAPGVVRPRRLT